MIFTTNKTYLYEAEGVKIEFKSIPAEFSERACASIIQEDNPYFIEYLFNKITDNKYDVSEFEAGIIINVIFSALKISGTVKDPVDIPTKIEEMRESVTHSLYYSIFHAITRVIPTYKLEDLQSKTTNELIELLVYAEKVSGREIFDTAKLKDIFKKASEPATQSSKKGVAAVSREDIDFLQQMLSKEERDGPGF